MSTPPSPPGYVYTRYNGQNLSVIDQELSAGRPVIVHIASGRDGHFIVLKSGVNGSYTMNDPLYEADLPFGNKYALLQIDSVRTFTPN